jgi:hypothetical protein
MLLRYLCERAFRSRVNPAGSGSGRAMVETPNQLNAGPILPVSGNGVNIVYYQITIFCQRTVLAISAKRANFSGEAVECCACGLRRVPQRNVRIGNLANAL